jgi:predicted RNA-binding protein associated with RNAse of E/G family
MSAKDEEFTVYKLDHNGCEVWQYPARVLERTPQQVRLEAFFNRDDMALGYVVFRRGDRFVETFYSDRWYNVFAVYDRDSGALKGWYGNVCRPAEITNSAVRCEDLALDVWVSPEGGLVVLDEDEFAALPLTEEERARGLAAIQELRRLTSIGALPC